MPFSFINLHTNTTIKRRIIFATLFLLIPSFNLSAQTIVKTNIIAQNISIRPIKTNLYKPFDFPLSKTIDYSNYPLTAGQILRRESQIRGYNRMYNLITNKNKNGFVGNFLGLPRIQNPHADPRF